MRNLLLFLYRNNYTLTFLALECICFWLMIQNNNFQNASVFNSANRFSASVLEAVSFVNEYIHLKTTNRFLAAENARLRSMGSWQTEDQLHDSTWIDTLAYHQYEFTAARVVNNSINRRNNYLTLDKGRLHGVEPEMGVVSASGVVGIVKDVSDRYCTVLSLLHKDSRISARFSSNQYFGSLVWNGTDPEKAQLKDIARHVPVQLGDTIVTTAYSAVFPPGVLIGTVSEFEVKPGDYFYTIYVKLSVSFGSLTHVYIVNNKFKAEQRQLEKAATPNDQ